METEADTGAMRHKLRTAWSHRKLERHGRAPFRGLQREHVPADPLGLGFWPPEL